MSVDSSRIDASWQTLILYTKRYMEMNIPYETKIQGISNEIHKHFGRNVFSDPDLEKTILRILLAEYEKNELRDEIVLDRFSIRKHQIQYKFFK